MCNHPMLMLLAVILAVVEGAVIRVSAPTSNLKIQPGYYQLANKTAMDQSVLKIPDAQLLLSLVKYYEKIEPARDSTVRFGSIKKSEVVETFFRTHRKSVKLPKIESVSDSTNHNIVNSNCAGDLKQNLSYI